LIFTEQKHLESLTTPIDPISIRYDYDAVVDPSGLIEMSYEDINTLMFLLLFNEQKHIIYDRMATIMLKFFFPHHPTVHFTYTKLFTIFKTLKKTSLNMNKFLSILIKSKRDFYYRYTLNTFIAVLDIISIKLDYYNSMYQQFTKTIISNCPDDIKGYESKMNKTKATIAQYEFLSTLLTGIINDQEKFKQTCDFILDHFIAQNIKFHSIIPYHIYFGIIKMYAHKPNTRTGQNDGPLIEQEFAKLIKNGDEFDEVVKSNINLIINPDECTGKKGEFDIVIGVMTARKDMFKIRSVYDIKRSARLIPDDIDKFNSALSDKRITLKEYTSSESGKSKESIKLKCKKFRKYKKGYIYVNDWDIEVETTYKLRDILISMITKNAQHSQFFIDFCNMIKYDGDHIYLKLNSILRATLSEMIDVENDTIRRKLTGFEIRKYVPSF